MDPFITKAGKPDCIVDVVFANHVIFAYLDTLLVALLGRPFRLCPADLLFYPGLTGFMTRICIPPSYVAIIPAKAQVPLRRSRSGKMG